MRRAREPRLSNVGVGLIVLAVAAAATFFGFTKANPFADPFVLRAAFRTANDVRPGAPVRIAGVRVGKVTRVDPGDESGAGAIVTMEIDDRGLPIHADARAKVRPRIFLEGNYFVELRPGSPSAPRLREGETLPVQQTSAPVQLGQVLTALQRDTRRDMQRLFREYGTAVSGEGGRGFNRSIPYWRPAFRDTALANDAARGVLAHDLSRYLTSAGSVTAALDRDRAALRDLFTNFAITAGALAEQQRRLTAAIGELPRFLGRGRRALGELDAAFPRLRAFVADLRPAVRSSRPNLEAGLPFARQARRLFSRGELGGLVADLRPAVPSLARLNRGGVPLQGELRRLASCQTSVILPTITQRIPDAAFPASGPVYEEAVKWLPGIAGESRSFDANGQYIRTLANSANYAYPLNDGRFLFTQAPLEGINPPKAAQPPLRADVPCETQEPPDLRSRPALPPAGRRVSQSGPGAQERYVRARQVAVRWLRRALRAEGLARRFDVALRDLTRLDLGRLDRPTRGGSR